MEGTGLWTPSANSEEEEAHGDTEVEAEAAAAAAVVVVVAAALEAHGSVEEVAMATGGEAAEVATAVPAARAAWAVAVATRGRKLCMPCTIDSRIESQGKRRSRQALPSSCTACCKSSGRSHHPISLTRSDGRSLPIGSAPSIFLECFPGNARPVQRSDGVLAAVKRSPELCRARHRPPASYRSIGRAQSGCYLPSTCTWNSTTVLGIPTVR